MLRKSECGIGGVLTRIIGLKSYVATVLAHSDFHDGVLV